jgi:putative Holliday junction resolvase
MRRLGLDIGEKRIGVAVSDPSGRVATPVSVLDARKLAGDPAQLRRLIEDYEPAEIVVGLPLTMGGEEGPQAREVRRFVTAVIESAGVPVVYHDERLTSMQAHQAMAAGGADSRARRGSVDKVAAALLLQTYLDAHREP